MGININWYRSLPEQEKQSCRNKLESDHRVAITLFEQAKKAYATCIDEEKPSSTNIATVVRHLENCRQEIKDLEDDMGKISAYSYSSGFGGASTSFSTIVVCDDRDPYLALNSILGNGIVNIRPADFCNRPAAGVKSFKQICENRKNEIESRSMRRWVHHHGEFTRSTKKDEPAEQKIQQEQKQQEQRQQEQKEQREQKAKGAQ